MVARTSFAIVGNNLVQRYESDQVSAPVTGVVEYLRERLGGTTDLQTTPTLPLGCRAFFKNGVSYNYLVEVPPGRHDFNYDFAEDEDHELNSISGSFSAVMPWQYFLFTFTKSAPNAYGITEHFQDVKLYWANNRFVDWSSLVYKALLPNLNENAAVCLGDAFPDSQKSVCERIETVVNEFYDHTFNADLGRNSPYDEDIDTWESESRKSLLIYRNWQVNPYRFKDYIGVDPDIIGDTDIISLNNLLLEAIQKSGAAQW